jgi:hypothetical protein
MSPTCRAFAITLVALATVAAHPSPVTAQVISMTAADARAFIRAQPGARVVLLYRTTCRHSHEMFPEVVALTERYSPLGVRFLAFSIDEQPDLLEEYLGSVGYDFERLHIQRWQPGELIAALEPVGIDVRTQSGTPHIAVIDAEGQVVGQMLGGSGARQADQWLRSLGFRPAED